MTTFSKVALSSLALLGAFLPALSAHAEDLAISATVVSSCAIATTPVAFGSYDPMVTHAAAPLDGAGSVTVTCTSGSTAHILLGQGLNPNGGSDAAPARQMASGANLLSYDLYTDTTRLDVWGNTDLTGVDQLGTGTAGTTLVVYGRVPFAQNVPAGSYTDTVAATVTF